MKSNIHKSVPILVIGFSRTQKILQIILKLREYGMNEIYLALDYPTEKSTLTKQIALIDELMRLQWEPTHQIQIWHRTKNHGVGVGVITALDWFFSKNQFGIIIEDDLEFTEDFLHFCALGLAKFEHSNEVLMISGNRYSNGKCQQSALVVASNYPQIWGWATWKSKWIEIRSLILKHKILKFRNALSPNVCFFFAGALRAQRGFIDTWDIPLAYEMLIRKKICILPPVNLVKNTGNDIFASHTFTSDFPLNFPIDSMPHCAVQSLEEIEATIRDSNMYLEQNIFHVKRRHIMSPFKFLCELVGAKLQKKKYVPLNVRLETAEDYV